MKLLKHFLVPARNSKMNQFTHILIYLYLLYLLHPHPQELLLLLLLLLLELNMSDTVLKFVSLLVLQLFETLFNRLSALLFLKISFNNSHKLLLLLFDSQINLTINAVISESNVYTSVAIKKVSSNAANVTIKNVANINAATAIGFLKSFCNTTDIIITAIGNAKNINNVFIFLPPYVFWYII